MAAPRRRTAFEKVGNYDVGRTIGRGNFANVKIARHRIAKTKVAIKIINLSKLDNENLIKIGREVDIVKSISHPHIAKSYEIIRNATHIYIVSEYCECGELYETLIEKGKVPEDIARRWFSQTASAVAYLHSKGIVHRDLKAENIMLDKNSEIKLIDFGFSNIQIGDQLLDTWCGSPPYAAPELLLGKSYDGMKADIWSMGVLLYILVTGGFPFPSDSLNKLKRSVLSGQVKIPYWVSVECADFIRKMLVLNPCKRYSIHNVLQHRWLTGTEEGKQLFLSLSNNVLSSSASCSSELQFNRINPTILLFMQQHGKWTEEQIIDAVTKKDFESPIFATYELLNDKVKKNMNDKRDDYPRRGSRGSILSGKANVEQPSLTSIISAHQLAQLNLSSPDCDSDDSSSSDIADDCSKGVPDKNSDKKLAVTLDINTKSDMNRHENRRHTLCASEQFISSNYLNQFLINSSYLANGTPSNTPLGMLIMPEGLPANFNLPVASSRIGDHLQYNERRSSAGEAYQLASMESHKNKLKQNANTFMHPEAVDEDGISYLYKFGGKRNTVHSLGNQYPGVVPSSAFRYNRSPYAKAPPSERRSSWASTSISAHQQNHLEKLFRQTLQSNNDIQLLHKEFKELSSNFCQQSNQEGSSSLTCPQISVTDEYNRKCNINPSSSTFDPVVSQRPATALGFSSSATYSGSSTPEKTVAKQEDNVKSFVTSLPFVDVVEELKNELNSLKIPFSETNEVVFEEHEMRRLSLPTGVEIGVAVLPPEQKAHVEFAILTNDTPSSEILCDQLINRLRMFDPNSRFE